MSLARLVITAVKLEGRTKSEVAREYGISRFWVQQLVHRFEVEGEAAFQPRSRRPHSNRRAVSLEVEDQIIRLRKQLSKTGLDAGAETIAVHLDRAGVQPVPAVSTIWRILSRRGFVPAQPQKRPRSSWHRFCAEQPNERWQADITHWWLADGTEVEILNILDDHSRVCIASVARRVLTLGSPHHGTSQAALGRELAGGCPTACEQLVPDSDLLRKLNSGDETPDGPLWATIRSTGDQVVTPVDSAALDGAVNILVQDVCPGATTGHGDLPGDPATKAALASVLGVDPPQSPPVGSC